MKKLLVALVAGALTSGAASAADKITVGLTPSITNAVAYVAEQEGIFDKNGLDVEFVAGGGSVLVSGVVSGSMAFSGPTFTTILQGIDSGLPYKVVLGLNVPAKKHQEYAVVISKKAGIKSAADFSGKTVGVSTINALLHVMFMSYLHQNGVDPTTVRFVEVPFPQMGDVMSQGTVDAVVAVQPFTTRMVANDLGTMGPDFVNELPAGLPLVAFVASDSYIASNRDAVNRFVASLKEAEAFIAKNPEKAIEDSNVFLKMAPEVIAQVKLPAYQLDIDPSKIAEWVKIMRSMSLLQNELKAENVLMQN
jgi:NitT/TauT family transport system substrate-binding protein